MQTNNLIMIAFASTVSIYNLKEDALIFLTIYKINNFTNFAHIIISESIEKIQKKYFSLMYFFN